MEQARVRKALLFQELLHRPDREDVVAVGPLWFRHEDLDPVVKAEQELRPVAVPQGRVER